MSFDEYLKKNYQLLYKYLIRLEDYEDLLDFQGGLCPICGQEFAENCERLDKPCLDHDHETGEVRGIIHARCNLLLGFAKDDLQILERAQQYLKMPPARIFFCSDLIEID